MKTQVATVTDNMTQRPLLDSEIVNPCSGCQAPVFLLEGEGAPHDYESQEPHNCPRERTARS